MEERQTFPQLCIVKRKKVTVMYCSKDRTPRGKNFSKRVVKQESRGQERMWQFHTWSCSGLRSSHYLTRDGPNKVYRSLPVWITLHFSWVEKGHWHALHPGWAAQYFPQEAASGRSQQFPTQGLSRLMHTVGCEGASGVFTSAWRDLTTFPASEVIALGSCEAAAFFQHIKKQKAYCTLHTTSKHPIGGGRRKVL